MFLAFPSYGMEPKTSQEFPPLERSDSDPQNPDEVNQKAEHEAEMKRDQLGGGGPPRAKDDMLMQKKENGLGPVLRKVGPVDPTLSAEPDR